MRSQTWVEDQHRATAEAIRQAAERGTLGFADVEAALRRIAFDGPTCGAAARLAGYLRPVPLGMLINAADEGAGWLRSLGERPRSVLRTAPDEVLGTASADEAEASFSRPAGDYASSGPAWIDRRESEIGSVAFALQALEWAVRPPSEQVVSY